MIKNSKELLAGAASASKKQPKIQGTAMRIEDEANSEEEG